MQREERDWQNERLTTAQPIVIPEGAAPGSPEAEEFERQEELDQVEEFIKNSQFGTVSSKTEPFSKQLQQESRRFFRVDADLYAKASELQSLVIQRIFLMRIFTLLLFGAFSTFAFTRAVAPHGSSWFSVALDIPATTVAAMDVALAGLALSIIRFLARREVIQQIAFRVGNVRNELRAKHTWMVNECRFVAHEINSIGSTATWPDRAAKSTKVALWYAMRADYLDRYSTTALWKIETFFDHAEKSFLCSKVIIAALVAILIQGAIAVGPHDAGQDRSSYSTWLSYGAYLAVGVFGWFIAHRQKNDFIGLLFNEGLTNSARTHYFEAVAGEIRNLAKLAAENIGRH